MTSFELEYFFGVHFFDNELVFLTFVKFWWFTFVSNQFGRCYSLSCFLYICSFKLICKLYTIAATATLRCLTGYWFLFNRVPVEFWCILCLFARKNICCLKSYVLSLKLPCLNVHSSFVDRASPQTLSLFTLLLKFLSQFIFLAYLQF